MEIGIIGLPFSGKTTMFATLTGQEISQIHMGSKVEAHRGVVKVQDDRLDYLATIFKPKKKVNTTIEYLDVGGVKSDTSQKIGFDAQFLAILKNTDALCLVIRAFEDEMYPHPDGSINVLRDLQNVETEFILSDLSIIEGRIDRLEKQIAKQKSEEAISDLELMRKFKEHLETEKPLREFELSAEESFKIRGFQFLSVKPLIVTVNYGEEGIVGEANILKELNEYRNKKNVIII
jgi:ribosome-binding ATPase YchF (GTP1/OBG family)